VAGQVRRFYRAVRTDPPAEDDFLSNWARHARDIREGRTPRELPDIGEALHMWGGISVYDTDSQAERQAQRFALGAFIACLEIPPESSIWIEKTGGRSHFTLWGTPAALSTCLQSRRQVQEARR